MEKEPVKLNLYQRMEYRGTVEYLQDRNTMHDYVNACNKFAEEESLEYDIIKVDERLVLTPIADNIIFVAGVHKKIKKAFNLVIDHEILSLSEIYDEEKSKFDGQQRMIDDIEELMTRKCDLCDYSMHITEVVFKDGNPTCPKCGNSIKL